MSDDRIARPVSGEIMSGAAAAPAARREPADFVDADYETVHNTAESRHVEAVGFPNRAQRSAGMDILKGSDSRAGARGKPAGPLFWLFGLALALGAFWVSGGHALVSHPAEPPLAAPSASPQPPLRIVDVTSRLLRDDTGSFLVVDGTVSNTTDGPLPIPALSIRVTGRDGLSKSYFLGTNGHVLEAGSRFPFSSRLAAPNEGVGTVTVDFRREGNR